MNKPLDEEAVLCPSDCSGHGKCLSMAEAASGWDGRLLVRPNVVYTSIWDADVLHGCVCDPGWIGYNCSQLECPRGDDPLTTVTTLRTLASSLALSLVL